MADTVIQYMRDSELSIVEWSPTFYFLDPDLGVDHDSGEKIDDIWVRLVGMARWWE